MKSFLFLTLATILLTQILGSPVDIALDTDGEENVDEVVSGPVDKVNDKASHGSDGSDGSDGLNGSDDSDRSYNSENSNDLEKSGTSETLERCIATLEENSKVIKIGGFLQYLVQSLLERFSNPTTDIMSMKNDIFAEKFRQLKLNSCKEYWNTWETAKPTSCLDIEDIEEMAEKSERLRELIFATFICNSEIKQKSVEKCIQKLEKSNDNVSIEGQLRDHINKQNLNELKNLDQYEITNLDLVVKESAKDCLSFSKSVKAVEYPRCMVRYNNEIGDALSLDNKHARLREIIMADKICGRIGEETDAAKCLAEFNNAGLEIKDELADLLDALEPYRNLYGVRSERFDESIISIASELKLSACGTYNESKKRAEMPTCIKNFINTDAFKEAVSAGQGKKYLEIKQADKICGSVGWVLPDESVTIEEATSDAL